MKSKLLIPIILIISIVLFWFVNAIVSGNFFDHDQYFVKGEQYFNEGKIKESIKEFNKVIKIEPENITARLFLAKAYFTLDEMDKSIVEYKKVLEMDNENTEAVLNIVNIYAKRANYIDLQIFMDKLKNDELIKKYKPEKPIANKATGLYYVPVALKFENEINSKVLYTTDGTEPTYNSKVFSEEIIFENGLHNIKAITVKNGFKSDVTDITLNINIKVLEINFENKEIESAVKKSLGRGANNLNNQDIAKIKSVLIFGKNIIISSDNISSVFKPYEVKKDHINNVNIEINGESQKKSYNNFNVNNDIMNLSDLKKFSNLETIIISGVHNFDIDLISHLTTLKDLNISYINKISNINSLEKLVSLKNLFLKNINIENISFLTNLINIQQLDISNNKIENISDIKNLKKLKKLNVSNNIIINITDLFKLKSLVSLSFDFNHVTSIEGIEQLNNLFYLSFASNHIDNIEYIKNLVTLEYISFNGNPVVEKRYAIELPYLKNEIKEEIKKNNYINLDKAF